MYENKNNKTILRFNKIIVCDILNKKYDFDKLIYNSNDEEDKSIIEFIDAEESNNTLIAINHKDIGKGFKQNMYLKNKIFRNSSITYSWFMC